MHASSHISVSSASRPKKMAKTVEKGEGEPHDFSNLPKEIIELLTPKESSYNWQGILSAILTIILILGIIGLTIFIITPYEVHKSIPNLSLSELGKIKSIENDFSWFNWHADTLFFTRNSTTVQSLNFNGQDRKLRTAIDLTGLKTPVNVRISPSGQYFLVQHEPKQIQDDIFYMYTVFDKRSQKRYLLPSIRKLKKTLVISRDYSISNVQWTVNEDRLLVSCNGNVYLIKQFDLLSKNIADTRLTDETLVTCLTCFDEKEGDAEVLYAKPDWRYNRYFGFNQKDFVWENPDRKGTYATIGFYPLNRSEDNSIDLYDYNCNTVDYFSKDARKCEYHHSYIPAIKRDQRIPRAFIKVFTEKQTLFLFNEEDLIPNRDISDGIYIYSFTWITQMTFILKMLSRDQRQVWIVLCNSDQCNIIFEQRLNFLIDLSCGSQIKDDEADFISVSEGQSVLTLLPNDWGQCNVIRIDVGNRDLVTVSPRNRHIYRILKRQHRGQDLNEIDLIGEYCQIGTRHVVRLILNKKRLFCLSCRKQLMSEDLLYENGSIGIQNLSSTVRAMKFQRSLFMPIREAYSSGNNNYLAYTWSTGLEPLGNSKISTYEKVVYRNRITDEIQKDSSSEDSAGRENAPDDDVHSNGIFVYEPILIENSYPYDECTAGLVFVEYNHLWNSVTDRLTNQSRNTNRNKRSANPQIRFKQKNQAFKPEHVEKPPITDIPLGDKQFISNVILENENRTICHSVQRRVNLDAVSDDEKNEKKEKAKHSAICLVQFWYPPDLNEKHIVKYSSVIFTNAINYKKANPYEDNVTEKLITEIAIYLATQMNIVVMRPLKWIGSGKPLLTPGTSPNEEAKFYVKLLQSLHIEYSQYLNPNNSLVVGIDEQNAHLAGMILRLKSSFSPKAGVLMNPIVDYSKHDVVLSERLFGKYNPVIFTQNMLRQEVDSLTEKPIFLLHSLNDVYVPFVQSVPLIRHLVEMNDNAEFMPYPYSTQDLINSNVRLDLTKRIAKFLKSLKYDQKESKVFT